MRRETGSRRPLDRNRREWRPVPTPLVPCELPGAVDKAKAAEEEDVAAEAGTHVAVLQATDVYMCRVTMVLYILALGTQYSSSAWHEFWPM